MGNLVYVVFCSLGSVVALFIMTKIMGNHQMSQLTMFDYINGITIGSIAAEMATALEDFYKPLTAMVVYTSMSILFAVLTNKSLKARRWLYGRTLILYDNGKLYRDNLKKAKMDLNEFLTECRNQGYFNLSSMQTAILELNGKISILPTAAQRPVIPQDLNLSPPQDKLVVNVILDGQILTGNLKYTGNNEDWLYKQLKAQGYNHAEDIFLATCDSNNNLTMYDCVKKDQKRDLFT